MTFEEAFSLLTGWRNEATRYPDFEVAQFFDFCLRNIDGSQSQIFQDLFVLFETNKRRNGFFVEFGAVNGVHLSNSHMLEERFGWTGILAEPARMFQRDLKKNRHCVIDSRCVWSKSGETLAFNESGEVSTIGSFAALDLHAKVRENGLQYDVETISLTDLLDYHRAPRKIDYLSIDTEGSEFEILSNFDWGAYRIKIITVEHNFTPMREKIFNLLSSMGYRRKFESISKFDDWYVLDE